MAKMLLDVEYKNAQAHIVGIYQHAVNLFPEHAEKLEICDLEFSNRLKTTAGLAFFDRNMVRLSWEMYQLNRAEFYADTIAHEVAHLVAYRIFNDAGHGKAWKFVFYHLSHGKKPERCHNMYTRSNLPNFREFL